jgi:hypothetical protein
VQIIVGHVRICFLTCIVSSGVLPNRKQNLAFFALRTRTGFVFIRGAGAGFFTKLEFLILNHSITLTGHDSDSNQFTLT